MSNPQTLGNIIWKARRLLGLSQRELASKVGRDHIFISKLENDHIEPDSELIEALSRALGVSVETLSSAPVIAKETTDEFTIYCRRF